MLRRTGAVGCPSSKYQMAVVELVQNDAIPAKKFIILNKYEVTIEVQIYRK
jgi:hypothetical protein